MNSPYFKEYPINLNWLSNQRLRTLLNEISSIHLPITLFDVGARWGIPTELEPIKSILSRVGFDADSSACNELNEQSHNLFNSNVYPFFIGSVDGEVEFFLYEDRSASSILKPNNRYKRLFEPNLNISKSINLKSVTLDTFLRKNSNIQPPDILKIDTQGSELDVLKGGVNLLKSTVLVDVEVQFIKQYENAVCFEDILSFMRAHGFDLVYLNRVTQQRFGCPLYSKGQLTFGDAIFARREDCLDGFSDSALIRYILILFNYGFFDIAYSLLEKIPDSKEKNIITQVFNRTFQEKLYSKILRILNPIIDNFILFLLNLRKHNSLFLDSDRSWPTR